MKYLKLFICGFIFLLISCLTLEFDRNSLQANDYSLIEKLPNLEIKAAETTQIGAYEQVSTSSYIYTVFRRELEKNVLDVTSEEVCGSIEMILIYSGVDIDKLWGGTQVTLEFEINIYDRNSKKIWNNVYSADIDMSSYTFTATESTIRNVGVIYLEHELLDQFKDDIALEYASICSELNQL